MCLLTARPTRTCNADNQFVFTLIHANSCNRRSTREVEQSNMMWTSIDPALVCRLLEITHKRVAAAIPHHRRTQHVQGLVPVVMHSLRVHIGVAIEPLQMAIPQKAGRMSVDLSPCIVVSPRFAHRNKGKRPRVEHIPGHGDPPPAIVTEDLGIIFQTEE